MQNYVMILKFLVDECNGDKLNSSQFDFIVLFVFVFDYFYGIGYEQL